MSEDGVIKPGDVIDRYTVEGEIASGGMAEVYRVRHNQLGSTHALKVLTLRTKDIKRRLLQEGRVQAALKHPNAIMVTDVVEVDGHPGLVMEYVDGPTLGDWLHLDDPNYAEVERVFRAITSAVGEAHRIGLIHRDIKPSNVLMARAGNRRIPKVIDFGLAKVVREVEADESTRTGVPMGTPSYMAPEQVTDAKNVDRRADIFSLGALLYYLCSRKKAFTGDNAVEVYNAVLSGDFAPVLSVKGDVPMHLVAAIEGCLRIDRNDRIQSTTDLLAVLDGSTGVSAAPPPPSPPWIPIAIGVIGLGVLSAVWLAGSTSSPSSAPVGATFTGAIGEHTTEEVRTARRHEAHIDAKGVPIPRPVRRSFCGAKPNTILGFVEVPGKARRATSWVVDSPTPLAGKSGGELTGCVLPTGTTIEVIAKPIRDAGVLWLAVYGHAFELP